MRRPLLGAHVSVAGGFDNGVLNGEKIGAEVIQIFGSSPRQWRVVLPDKEKIISFKKALKDSSVSAVYLHAPYLINLGTENPELLDKSEVNLTESFKIANLLGAKGLVFHIGSSKGGNVDKAREQVVRIMKRVLKNVSGSSKLLMENSASKKKIGASFNELSYLYKKIGSKRVGVCLDTAHAFESGIFDGVKSFLDNCERELGLDKVYAFHTNDSKTKFGSNNDRHENLGKGYIGLPMFKQLAKDKRVSHTDWILEVPGFDNLGPDKKNLDILKSCFI